MHSPFTINGLPLALLMFWFLADDTDDALTTDNDTFITDFFDRWTDFHSTVVYRVYRVRKGDLPSVKDFIFCFLGRILGHSHWVCGKWYVHESDHTEWARWWRCHRGSVGCGFSAFFRPHTHVSPCSRRLLEARLRRWLMGGILVLFPRLRFCRLSAYWCWKGE